MNPEMVHIQGRWGWVIYPREHPIPEECTTSRVHILTVIFESFLVICVTPLIHIQASLVLVFVSQQDFLLSSIHSPGDSSPI